MAMVVWHYLLLTSNWKLHFILDFSTRSLQGVPCACRLGFVDLDFECSTVFPTLLGRLGIWQKQPSSRARWWKKKSKSTQPSLRAQGTPWVYCDFCYDGHSVRNGYVYYTVYIRVIELSSGKRSWCAYLPQSSQWRTESNFSKSLWERNPTACGKWGQSEMRASVDILLDPLLLQWISDIVTTSGPGQKVVPRRQ